MQSRAAIFPTAQVHVSPVDGQQLDDSLNQPNRLLQRPVPRGSEGQNGRAMAGPVLAVAGAKSGSGGADSLFSSFRKSGPTWG